MGKVHPVRREGELIARAVYCPACDNPHFPNETVYVRPGHLLAFARREGRPPGRTEWLGIVRKHGAETKDAARTPDPQEEGADE